MCREFIKERAWTDIGFIEQTYKIEMTSRNMLVAFEALGPLEGFEESLRRERAFEK